MFEETTWGVMSSWCTPTMLFVLLNFMIATIFITSGFGSHKHPQPQPHLLHRSPSVLQRLKSINFYQYANYYRSHEPADLVPGVAPGQTGYGYEAPMQTNQMMMPDMEAEEAVSYPVMIHKTEEYEFGEEHEEDEYEVEDGFGQENGDKSLDEVYSQLLHGSDFNRTKSDTEPTSGAVPVKQVKKMKKSASSKSAFRHLGEAEMLEARRPATVREAKAKRAVEGEDEEVDSKADDFINKFKQQLKLQRLDSILRYKEMLSRGL